MKISDRRVSLDIDGIFSERISSPEEMLLFDIETTGLKKEYCQVYLIGCAYLDSDGWHIRQWLAQSPSDEPGVLSAFAAFAGGFRTLVTYNGDAFDIPVVDFRCGLYGIGFDIRSPESLDIYKEIRPLKALMGMKSLKQKSVEGLYGVKRDDRSDGGRLIPYYYDYISSADPEKERLLLLHNFEDVLGMGKILPVLNFALIREGKFSFLGYEVSADKLSLEFLLERGVSAFAENGKITICGNSLKVDFDIVNGKILIPLSDVENYYYLPAEDEIIHKDLASFVDRKHKIKATRQNCFLKIDTGALSSLCSDDFKAYAMQVINSF